jgi:hypothetical protein
MSYVLNPQAGRRERTMTEPKIKIHATPVIDGKRDLFVVVDGVRIAKRGYPDSPQAGTWVSLEPGWEVIGGEDTIAIRHNSVSVH